MNFKTPFLTSLLSLALSSAGYGQGTFQNLDFESATLIPIPGDPFGRGKFAPAFPGWTGYIDGQILTTTFPNGVPIGPPGQIPSFIAIMSPPDWIASQGSYEVGFGGSTSLVPVALTQTGLVPAGTMSLRFLALYAPDVFLNGQHLPSVSLGSGPSTRTVFGVDISAYAGQVRELRFQPGLGIDYLDDIQFSAQAIPEPGLFGFSVFATMFLGWRLRGKPNL